MLLNADLVVVLKKDIYFEKLAKAIQINSDLYSVRQKSELCAIANKVYSLPSDISNRFLDSEVRELSQVSLMLFFFSIDEPFSHEKYSIFLSMIYNIFFLQLLDHVELLELL